MRKIFFFLAMSLFFIGCEKEDEEIFGQYFDMEEEWEFTGKEWQFRYDGKDYSILETTEGKDYFFMVVFDGEEKDYDDVYRLYDYDKLEDILPVGYENPQPVIVDGSLCWVAFYQNDYKNVAVVSRRGKVKTYSNRTFRKGNFHSEVSSDKAYYERDNYHYTYRIFPED